MNEADAATMDPKEKAAEIFAMLGDTNTPEGRCSANEKLFELSETWKRFEGFARSQRDYLATIPLDGSNASKYNEVVASIKGAEKAVKQVIEVYRALGSLVHKSSLAHDRTQLGEARSAPTRSAGSSPKAMAAAVFGGMKGLVDSRIAPLVKRIEALEAQAKEAGNLRYVGVYENGKQYKKGNFATHAGALWHANVDLVSVKPGDGSSWSLAVKSGRA